MRTFSDMTAPSNKAIRVAAQYIVFVDTDRFIGEMPRNEGAVKKEPSLSYARASTVPIQLFLSCSVSTVYSTSHNIRLG